MITDLPDEAFTEPWQARLFAMAQVACSCMDQPWDAFRDRLKAAIAEQPDRPYYDSWMAALEQLTGCSPPDGCHELRGSGAGPSRPRRHDRP